MKKLFVLLICCLGMSHIQADGTITDGDATFNWATSGGIHSGGLYTMTTELGGSLLGYQYWFAYRTDSDTREFAFPSPDVEDYTGNQATLTWNDMDGKGFSVVVVLTLTDLPGDAASALADIEITNNSGSDLGIEVFTVMDFDKPFSGPGDDAAILLGPDVIQVRDDGVPDGLVCEFGGFGSVAYYVSSTGGSLNIRTLLDNFAIDDWANSGLPFGPDDFIGSFQYSFPSISNGGSVTVASPFSISVPVMEPMPIPTLGEWSLIILVLSFLIFGIVAVKRYTLSTVLQPPI